MTAKNDRNPWKYYLTETDNLNINWYFTHVPMF